MRLSLGVLALIFGTVCSAAAAGLSFDDYLARGFTVVRVTTIAGPFAGCVKSKQLIFADGSRFTCARAQPNPSYTPRVYILRHDTDAPSVVLIGGHPTAGSLTRLGTLSYSSPLTISADDPSLATSQSPDPDRIDRVEPIQSINALTAQASKRLNDAQVDLPQTIRRQTPGIDQ